MVLDYLNVPFTYDRLQRHLQATPFGTVFGNLRRLTKYGLHIHIQQGDFAQLRNHLDTGLPCIVAITTSKPFWSEATNHAVLVVGMNDTDIYVCDPQFDEGPRAIPLAEFELAWLEQDYLFALISLA